MTDALYLDTEASLYRWSGIVRQMFLGHRIALHCFSEMEVAFAEIDDDEVFSDPPGFAVIGPDIEKPIVIARKIQDLLPEIQFIFLASQTLSYLTRTLKSPAGGLRNDWEMVDVEDVNFERIFRERLDLLLKKRRFRTTLSGINRRLKQRSTPQVSDLNRYSVSTRFLSHIVDNAHESIVATNLEGTIVRWNLASENLFRLLASEAVGRSFFTLYRGNWEAMLRNHFAALLDSKTGFREFEIDISDFLFQPNRKKKVIEVSLSLIKNDASEKIGIAAFIRDITERKIAERVLEDIRKDLQRMSFEDGLTGIPNRRQFDAMFHKEWLRMQRAGKTLAVALLDVDHFKYFNDCYGHLAGDECLKKVAGTLQKFAKRSSDLVARYGGEEFVLLLPETSLGVATELVQNCCDAVHEMNILHEKSAVDSRVTLSAGVAAVVPDSSLESEKLLEKADAMLYEAKGRGRNQVCFET